MATRYEDDPQYYNNPYGSNIRQQPPRYNNARNSSYDYQETSRYPNLTKTFHNTHTGAPNSTVGIDIHDEYPHYDNREDRRRRAPASGARREKVRFAECEGTSDVRGREKREYKEEDVDNEADSFIKSKHQLFAIARWNTYRE